MRFRQVELLEQRVLSALQPPVRGGWSAATLPPLSVRSLAPFP